jgi:hypothetical protein
MATAAVNPAYLLDPSLYGDQQAIGQQQALAQALMTQGLAPMGETQMAGQVALRNSPTQSIAKLVQLLSGQDIQRQVNQANQGFGQKQAAAMAQMFGAGPQGAPQGDPSQQPQPMPAGSATPAGAMGLPGMSPQQSFMSYAMSPEKYMESYLKGYTPNDTTIQARQGGFDPVVANRLALIKSSTDPKILGMQQAGMSPMQIYTAVFGEAAKGAEISRRPGEGYSNALTGEAGMVGKIPEGANVTGAPGPNGQVSLTPMPGNTGVLANNSAASTAGTNSQTPTTAYVNGQPAFSTKGMDVNRARAQAAVGPALAENASDLPGILDRELANEKDPVARAALQRERARITPEQAPGVVTGANDAQKQLGDRFGALRDTVSTAQTTNSYLDNIKQLSATAATGKFSDKQDFVNAVLSTAGISEKATDAKTANDLLNKYSNQIVSRLSTGGLGTDAARTILGSAYPNAHMTKDAIVEAVDNIKAVNEMQKAKLSLLSDAGNKRDAAAYQSAEQKFDQIADPRIWQLSNMDASHAKAFLAKMPDDMKAELRKRAAALKQMGVL